MSLASDRQAQIDEQVCPKSSLALALGGIGKLARTMTFRLTALYVGTALIAGAIVFFAIFHQTNAIIAQQITAEVSAETADFVSAERLGGVGLVSRMIEARANSGMRLYLLVGASGNRIAGNIADWPETITVGATGGTFRYRSAGATREGETRLGAGTAISMPDGAALLIGRDISAQHRLGSQHGKLFLMGFAGLAIAGLAGGLLASRFVLSRIGQISSTARSIMGGSFDQRIPVTGAGDELDQLAVDLNAMLERIEHLMASLKEVSDNIAHDLKTPLNRLRNHAEEALRANGSDVRLRDALEQVTDEADELIKTFNALLLIAKLESGAHEEGAEDVDLRALVADIGELYQPVADEEGRCVEVRQSGEDMLIVRGHRQLIGQALANMIENALKYGKRESQAGQSEDVVVEVAGAGNRVIISVSDHGPGIPKHERGRVLERFVRLEKSRSLPGTGLGLSLVAAVARLSGGEVRLEDNTPGLRIMLMLPRAP